MKKIFLYYMSMLLALVALSLLLTDFVTVQASTPSLSKKKITIYIGKTADLELENASNEVVWRSENDAVAKVDDDGVVKPVSVGNTKVIATYKNIDYSCEVTVKKPYLSRTEIEVFPFEFFDLSITGTKAKKWEISDETIMTAQRWNQTSYRIRALAEGEATFTVVGKDKQKYECHVIVKPCTSKASYYDKKHTKVKKISYYVDDRLAQYDSYYKGTGLKYSIRYTYDKDTYTEIQLGQLNTIKSKTVYDYNDNVVSEIIYQTRATLDNAEQNKLSEKYYDEEGFYHEKQYGVLSIDRLDCTKTSLLNETVYNKNMQVYKQVNYNDYNGVIINEDTFFPEDGKVAMSIRYDYDGNKESISYYNQDPYCLNKEEYYYPTGKIYSEMFYNPSPFFCNKKVVYSESGARTEKYYDSSRRIVRGIEYDENGNLINDSMYRSMIP